MISKAEQIKYQLQNAPARFRFLKAYDKWDTMQIIGEWESGGMCPWQAFLPVEYRGIKYTIYIRERHEHTTIHIMYGEHGMIKTDKYHGYASDDLLSDEDMDVAHPDNILMNYWEGQGDDYLFVPLYKRAEILAARFFEERKYNSHLPSRKFEE